MSRAAWLWRPSWFKVCHTSQQRHIPELSYRGQAWRCPSPTMTGQAKPRDDKAQCAQRAVVSWPLCYSYSTWYFVRDNRQPVSPEPEMTSAAGLDPERHARHHLKQLNVRGPMRSFRRATYSPRLFRLKNEIHAGNEGRSESEEGTSCLATPSAATVTAVIASGASVNVP